MSKAEVVVVRCDRPKCQTFARLPLDHPSPDDHDVLHALLTESGWTQFSAEGLLRYTADYCPTHKGTGHGGIRVWGSAPTPIREDVENGLVTHRSRRKIVNT